MKYIDILYTGISITFSIWYCQWYRRWLYSKAKANHKSLTLQLPDQICNSHYCQPYNSYNVSSENLVLDQLTIPKLKFFFLLNTYLVDIVWIL